MSKREFSKLYFLISYVNFFSLLMRICLEALQQGVDGGNRDFILWFMYLVHLEVEDERLW